MGVPPSPLPRLLWLLLLQRHAGRPPLPTPFLVFTHSTHDQEVFVWNGKCEFYTDVGTNLKR